MNFENWKCRASQVGKIMTGTIGITANQEATIQKLADKLASGKPLTHLQGIEYNDLIHKKNNPELPKTVITELRKIHRLEKYGRTYMFTNKYTQKGISEEEAGITLISLKLGRPLFKYNGGRVFNEFFQGDPDIVEKEEGHDNKCSWDLTTFPYPNDPLNSDYEWQNQVYMNLFGKEKWTTHYTLVNAPERLVNNEKMKYFYSMGGEESEEYLNICKEIERNMIFDIPRFQRDFPMYDFVNEDLDFSIPEEDRVISFVSIRNEDMINEAKDRIKLCREYLNSLQ